MSDPVPDATTCCPLREAELALVGDIATALQRAGDTGRELGAAIRAQKDNLDCLGSALARYPSPLEAQRLGDRRRSLDTLVHALSSAERVGFGLRAPTQSVVGRALSTAQINFFRLLWHACTHLQHDPSGPSLRERAACALRTSVYTHLVEEALTELATDGQQPQPLRARAVRQLAQLWAHRLTWRVSEFFPMLEATWEARSQVRVCGGTMLGTSEMFQLMTKGGDPAFVEFLMERTHADDAVLAFREFLFDRSYEELERLVDRMAKEGRSSIELDAEVRDGERDAGSIFYEFFQTRLLQANARRLARLPGPKHTAEGYVLLAWLEQITDPGPEA
jgi:hypothetical protein